MNRLAEEREPATASDALPEDRRRRGFEARPSAVRAGRSCFSGAQTRRAPDSTAPLFAGCAARVASLPAGLARHYLGRDLNRNLAHASILFFSRAGGG